MDTSVHTACCQSGSSFLSFHIWDFCISVFCATKVISFRSAVNMKQCLLISCWSINSVRVISNLLVVFLMNWVLSLPLFCVTCVLSINSLFFKCIFACTWTNHTALCFLAVNTSSEPQKHTSLYLHQCLTCTWQTAFLHSPSCTSPHSPPHTGAFPPESGGWSARLPLPENPGINKQAF